jgi:hypothetical protein
MTSDPRTDRIYQLATALWQQAQIVGLRREIDLWDKQEQAIAIVKKGEPT